MPARKRKKTCYVISPIDEEGSETRCRSDFLLTEIIDRAIGSKFEITRADKETKPGMIDSQIINAMFEADIVIADLTAQNANVFYELGIRHAAAKTTIHMIKEGEIIPFDNSPARCIKYSITHPSNLQRARDELIEMVQATEANDFKIDNPVTRARGTYKYVQEATTAVEAQIVEALERLQSFDSRLKNIEARTNLFVHSRHFPPPKTLLSEAREIEQNEFEGSINELLKLGGLGTSQKNQEAMRSQLALAKELKKQAEAMKSTDTGADDS